MSGSLWAAAGGVMTWESCLVDLAEASDAAEGSEMLSCEQRW